MQPEPEPQRLYCLCFELKKEHHSIVLSCNICKPWKHMSMIYIYIHRCCIQKYIHAPLPKLPFCTWAQIVNLGKIKIFARQSTWSYMLECADEVPAQDIPQKQYSSRKECNRGLAFFHECLVSWEDTMVIFKYNVTKWNHENH